MKIWGLVLISVLLVIGAGCGSPRQLSGPDCNWQKVGQLFAFDPSADEEENLALLRSRIPLGGSVEDVRRAVVTAVGKRSDCRVSKGLELHSDQSASFALSVACDSSERDTIIALGLHFFFVEKKLTRISRSRAVLSRIEWE